MPFNMKMEEKYDIGHAWVNMPHTLFFESIKRIRQGRIFKPNDEVIAETQDYIDYIGLNMRRRIAR